MNPSVLIAEGGWQSFELGSAEWTVLTLSAVAAVLAIGVGLGLVRSVLAADQGTPKMQEIAAAIQEGAWAYLRRQFRTIGLILVPVAAVVFLTSTEIVRPDDSVALSFVESGIWRTLAFVLGCAASGFTGYIGMTLATRGNVRTAAAARSGSMAAKPPCADTLQEGAPEIPGRDSCLGSAGKSHCTDEHGQSRTNTDEEGKRGGVWGFPVFKIVRASPCSSL